MKKLALVLLMCVAAFAQSGVRVDVSMRQPPTLAADPTIGATCASPYDTLFQSQASGDIFTCPSAGTNAHKWVRQGTTSAAAAVAQGQTIGASTTGNAATATNMAQPVNAQTGTSYTVVTGDQNKLVTFNNASAVAVTLPQCGSAGFPTGWTLAAQDLGTGAVTITPTTSTINGAATYALATGSGVHITCDGTNYQVQSGNSTFKQSGTGALVRAMQDWANDVVSAKSFVSDTTGATNQSTGLQNAANAAAGKTLYFPAGIYQGTFTVAANTRITGAGPSTILRMPVLTAHVGTPIITVTGSNVEIDHLKFDGQRASQPQDGYSDSFDSGTFGTGRSYRAAILADRLAYSLMTNLTVHDVEITGMYGAGVASRGVSNVKFRDNYCHDSNFECGFLYSAALTGVTVTGLSGTNSLTISPDATHLSVGERILITGQLPLFGITAISGTTLTLDTALTADVTGATVWLSPSGVGVTNNQLVNLGTGDVSVTAAAYVSGGSVTGTAGQTCIATFSGSTQNAGTATLTLASGNTLAGATFSSYNSNNGYVWGNTYNTATLANGTASSCVGPISVTTTLNGTSADVNSNGFVITAANNFTFSNNRAYMLERNLVKLEVPSHGVVTSNTYDTEVPYQIFSCLQTQGTSGSYAVTDLLISGLNCRNTPNGVQLGGDGMARVSVINSTFDGLAVDGVELMSASNGGSNTVEATDVSILHNHFKGVQRYGLYIQQGNHLKITDNDFTGTGASFTAGINIAPNGFNMTDAIVTGNVVRNFSPNNSSLGGLMIRNTSAETVSALQVRNNYVLAGNATWRSMDLFSSANSINGVISGNTMDGVVLGNAQSGLTFDNNTAASISVAASTQRAAAVVSSGGANQAVTGVSSAGVFSYGTFLGSCQLDLTTVCFADDFITGAIASASIGTLGWNMRTVTGGTATFAPVTSASPNIGIGRISNGTSGDGVLLLLDTSGAAQIPNISSGPAYDSDFIARANQTTNEQWRFGYIWSATTGIPQWGAYARYDTNLTNVASAICNDAGNKCGLTTLTCSAGDTVTFNIDGGTATGSVACTGTNAIANGTAVTVVAAGGGYNATGGAATATVTGGTSAVHTGTIALTPTLGAAASGADTHFWLCSTTGSKENCVDTGIAADTAFHKLRVRQVASGKIGMTFYDATGVVQLAEKTFCAAGSGCDVSCVNNTNGVTPGFVLNPTTSSSPTADVDLWMYKATGLAR